MLPSLFRKIFVPAMCSGKVKDKLVPFMTLQSGDQELPFVRLAVAAGVAHHKHRTDLKSGVLGVKQLFRLGRQRTTRTSLGRTPK
jgi:hypothetical protein